MKAPQSHFETLQKINTHRTFLTFFSNSHSAPATHTFQEILNYSITDYYEWAHALNDNLDQVLDLQIGQSLFFYPNRDEKDSPTRELAMIKRTR